MGGAAIATKRLMQALRSDGLDATMLVRDKTSTDPHVVALPGRFQQRFNFLAERAGVWAANGFRRRNLFVVDTAAFGTNILRQTLVQEADIVHLNWVNQGMMSLQSIAQLLQAGKKVVWTLHDMWPLTGICHHAEDCRGWLASCGNCPKLLRPAAQDLSRQTFEKKKRTYGSARLKIVACSNWLADLARQAPLLRASEVFSIPNAIDTQFFSPGSKAEARAALGLFLLLAVWVEVVRMRPAREVFGVHVAKPLQMKAADSHGCRPGPAAKGDTSAGACAPKTCSMPGSRSQAMVSATSPTPSMPPASASPARTSPTPSGVPV